MSDLRVKLHSNNINLSKILSKQQINKLTKADFFTLIAFIDKSMTEESISLLFSYIVSGDGYILVEDLKKFFTKYQIRLTGIDPS